MLKNILIGMLLSFTVYADNETKIYTKCIKGYVFVVSETKIDYLDDAIFNDIEQLFVEQIVRYNGIKSVSVPLRCEGKVK